jgi:hypothetical protein
MSKKVKVEPKDKDFFNFGSAIGSANVKGLLDDTSLLKQYKFVQTLPQKELKAKLLQLKNDGINEIAIYYEQNLITDIITSGKEYDTDLFASFYHYKFNNSVIDDVEYFKNKLIQDVKDKSIDKDLNAKQVCENFIDWLNSSNNLPKKSKNSKQFLADLVAKQGQLNDNSFDTIKAEMNMFITAKLGSYKANYNFKFENWFYDDYVIDCFDIITHKTYLISSYNHYSQSELNWCNSQIQYAKLDVVNTLNLFTQSFLELSKLDAQMLYDDFISIILHYTYQCKMYGFRFEDSYFYHTVMEYKQKYKAIIADRMDDVALQPIAINTSQYNKTIEDDEPLPRFTENKFNHLDESIIENHFINGLKPYADEATINKFLFMAFENEDLIGNKLVFTNKENNKRKIMQVFYRFYNVVSGKPIGKANIYASLLANYFEGFEVINTARNWNK